VQKFSSICYLGWLVLALPGCVIQPPPIADSVVEEKYGDLSVEEGFQRVNKALGRAKLDDLDRYAPKYYSAAESAMEKARGMQRQKAASKDILKYVFLAEQNLEKAQNVKQLAEESLSEIFSQIKNVERRNPQRSHSREFNKLMEATTDLIQRLEKLSMDKSPDAKQKFEERKQALLAEWKALEINVVKHQTLSKAEKALEEAELMEAEELAPATFSIAKQSHARAIDVIERDVNDDEAIEDASQAFRFAAFHALHVTRGVDYLRNLEEEQYEEHVLEVEKSLMAITSALQTKDVRDHPFTEQARILGKEVSNVVRQNKHLSEELEQMENPTGREIQALKEEKQNALERLAEKEKSIRKLEQRVRQLETGQEPLQQKIWLLEKNMNELVAENQRLRSKAANP
jgi:predicted  nucleic acid-binding Zn-ribbon protein